MRLRSLLMVGSLLSAPTLAWAQPISGLYIGAGAGANFLQNQTIKRLSLANGGGDILGHTNPKFDVGLAAVGSIGWGFGNGLRAELEGNYRNNDLRSIGGYGTGMRGSEQKAGAMINVLYDLDLRPYGVPTFGLTPYIGAGAGYAHAAYSHVTVASQDGSDTALRVNNSNDMFAYQAIAGFAYPLDSIAPGLALTAEYRFYSTPNDRKYSTQFFGPGVTTGGKVKISDDFNHSAMIGIRYAFNAAPPPPPPAPVPVAAPVAAPSRTYLVFFDWDRADLTSRARQIVAEAAQNSTRVQYTRIEVNGYTDRSGTPQYNQRLSVRRAETVAGELVRDGVPRSAINIQGFGENNPLVPTAAGVREPQNRRVQIIIR